jgi:hypothetical protein
MISAVQLFIWMTLRPNTRQEKLCLRKSYIEFTMYAHIPLNSSAFQNRHSITIGYNLNVTVLNDLD